MSGNVPTGSLFIVFCEFFGLSLFGFVSLIKLVNRRCCYVWIWRLVGSTIQSKEEEKTLHFAPCTQLYSCHFNAQVLAWEPASATLMHKSFVPPTWGIPGGKRGKSPLIHQLVFPWEAGWMFAFTSLPKRSGDERGVHISLVSSHIFMLLGNLNIWHKLCA